MENSSDRKDKIHPNLRHNYCLQNIEDGHTVTCSGDGEYTVGKYLLNLRSYRHINKGLLDFIAVWIISSLDHYYQSPAYFYLFNFTLIRHC